MTSIRSARRLSPRRNTTCAESTDELVNEQLHHFGIDPASEFGTALAAVSAHLYEAHGTIEDLWNLTLSSIREIEVPDRIARFNAKKFLSFQFAKLLDMVQSPSRASYQSLGYRAGTHYSKGPYPVFDNVTAIFSATPVITRTATYIYACAEWIEDAFKGRELLLEIYSRLLNPTSVSLANYIVDLEAGPYADDYLAWNFNSGMAAIDAVLAHLVGRGDIVITSRHIYGGAYQLLYDWYAKPANMNLTVVAFDGYTAEDFKRAVEDVYEAHRDRIDAGSRVYVYLESPSNPNGYVLDVAGICAAAHGRSMRVMLDATVATPFLSRPLQRENAAERPDFVIHSYTKDLSGTGTVVAGVVIGRNQDMFIPKGDSMNGTSWADTLFWNVYYVKGAFLNADAAFDVIQGIKTLEGRMLTKCINTAVLALFLDRHPLITVKCNVLDCDPNSALRSSQLFLGLPAPLFTIDFEQSGIGAHTFQSFFDSLSPTFAHMISLGQSNTIVSCPALTTHSELSPKALEEADITATTIRIAVGDEDVLDLIGHFMGSARLTIEPHHPGFCEGFMTLAEASELVRATYINVHTRYIDARLSV